MIDIGHIELLVPAEWTDGFLVGWGEAGVEALDTENADVVLAAAGRKDVWLGGYGQPFQINLQIFYKLWNFWEKLEK